MPYGTEYTVSIAADTGYNAGTLSTTGGTLTGNITVSATAATINDFKVTVVQPAHGVITINGNGGTTFTFNYGAAITLLCTPNSGYKIYAMANHGYLFNVYGRGRQNGSCIRE